ncbi:MAG TPA: hypothetical protein VFG69_06265, partial [Nannocystaceae bacterium]|nr:hypothetical protein [Nannocystaceae bacterium]
DGDEPATGATVGQVDDGADDGVDDAGDDGTPADDGDADDGGSAAEELSPEEIRFYLAKLAPKLAGRSLTLEENAIIDAGGEETLTAVLEGWANEPGFGEAVRYMVSDMLHASGERDGVDFELPGNLAAEIATGDLPWSTILTADYCVAADGSHIDCDTGAPYTAGVLATRAYLIANKGRFNLTRAKQMLEIFACRKYPMEPEIQIPLEKEVLIPMFRAQNPEEQTVEEAKGGFGNGVACYTCHSQFGAHAQLFVKYNGSGLWVGDATGLQDPTNELGRSVNDLYTSHMNDPAAAASEESQVFGQPVANLSEAGEVIATSPLFQQCTVKNLIGRSFGVSSGATDAIDADIVAEIAQRVTANDDDPTIRAYVMEVFTDRRIIETVLDTMGGE